MTEARFKEKKNKQASTDSRISTHPSYTEYAWESIVASGKEHCAAGTDMGRAKRFSSAGSAAAAKAPIGGTYAGGRADIARGSDTVNKAKSTAASGVGTAVKKKARSDTAEKIKKKSIVAMHTVVVEKKYAFPMSIVMMAACFTVLIMAIVTTSVQINEITSENAALQGTYTSLINAENELRLQLETRDDLRVVETVAKEELGMVKKDQVERYYLTVHKEDRIEIIEEKEDTGASFLDGVMSFGGSVMERVRGFFGR